MTVEARGGAGGEAPLGDADGGVVEHTGVRTVPLSTCLSRTSTGDRATESLSAASWLWVASRSAWRRDSSASIPPG